MIVNNLLLKLKNREEDTIRRTQEVLLSMRGKIEVLMDIQVEVNIRPGQSNYDLILITKFESLEALDVYLSHPAHLEVAKFIGSILDTQASVCYKV
ncbi:Dabb family protein [Clostridium paridis]|uniref:Dabb family protein n=1 Tax=Clostridium paridis TaxID=2803863 RepID=A0A937K4L9_9CLOT|nr:Dabb family protein [Clostridium paridis]MBL4932802.1 Dabb family protein [Clostridium paridis]